MSSSLVDAPALDNAEACESLVSQIAELHTGSLSDDGNWLTDNDEEADEALYLDREGKRRREEFYNAGYRDGVAAGRNDAAQDGFNQGFKESVMVGYKWGIVRGLTSAFTHIPKDLQLKLVESEDTRENFLNLSEAVNSIGNEDALKLFNDGIQRGASAERSKIIESEASTRPSGSEHSGLESYFGKMDLLLNESVQLKVNKYRVP
ncbi:uncharacterized protein LOC130818844 [Amaranthus tricolor]|uniref:uncharacterized protein LOC130818844 n=1 Tax=Amaranthus tricolor TaxID=29722 RepID=UPI0025901C60|nr:uncharacterized protein LOC130818844 [Amaranthus tricolor]XP_057541066.1 uncharacterized protein LOC130818844 [Amaranthus tricolor]